MNKHLLLLLPVGLCSGCAVPTIDLPPEITEVEANRTLFFTPEDDPLLDVEPGTIIDELDGLHGCWGFAAQASTDSGFYDLFEFIRFDFEAGTAARQILLQNPLIITLVQDNYTVSSGPEPDAVTLDLVETSWDGVVVVDVIAQELFGIPPQEPRTIIDIDEAQPFAMRVVLDGDAFVITQSTARLEDALPPFVEGRIYRRFDCPDSVPSSD